MRTLMAYKRGEPRVCSMARAPTPEEEDWRRVCRERRTLMGERVRHVNRIKGLLSAQGVFGYEPLRKGRRLSAGSDASLLPAHSAADCSCFSPFNRYRWDRHRISLGAFLRQHHLKDKTLSREDAMHQETTSILRARACKTIGRVLTVLVFSTAFLRPDLAIGGGFQGGGSHGGFHGGGFHGPGGGFHGGFPGGGFHPGISGFHGGGSRPGFLGFHGGRFHPGLHEFHAGGFHPGFHEFHADAFQPGFHEFHAGGFHDSHFGEFQRFGELHRFDHHGFRRGLVVVPAFGAWWGGGWGWPDYYYPEWWGTGWGWPDYYHPNGGYYGSGPYAGYWYYCADPPGYYPYVIQCNTAWQTVPAS